MSQSPPPRPIRTQPRASATGPIQLEPVDPPRPKPVPRTSVESATTATRPPRQVAGAEAPARNADLDRKIKLGIVAVAAVLMLAGLVLGAAPTKIVVCLIALVTLQGLWRGAGELVGLLSSTLLA